MSAVSSFSVLTILVCPFCFPRSTHTGYSHALSISLCRSVRSIAWSTRKLANRRPGGIARLPLTVFSHPNNTSTALPAPFVTLLARGHLVFLDGFYPGYPEW